MCTLHECINCVSHSITTSAPITADVSITCVDVYAFADLLSSICNTMKSSEYKQELKVNWTNAFRMWQTSTHSLIQTKTHTHTRPCKERAIPLSDDTLSFILRIACNSPRKHLHLHLRSRCNNTCMPIITTNMQCRCSKLQHKFTGNFAHCYCCCCCCFVVFFCSCALSLLLLDVVVDFAFLFVSSARIWSTLYMP